MGLDLKSLGKILEQPASIKLICLILFLFLATIGLWVRPNLFGVDSYSTLAFIRFGFVDTLGNQPVANFVFGLLPDSIVLFKLIMFSSIVSAMIPIWLLVKKFYDERIAWISLFLLVSLSPIVLFMFGEFENEVFAYPLIVWGIYWLLMSNYKKGWLLISNYLFALIYFTTSLLFWKWPYYLTFFNNSSTKIVEMQLFAGLINLWALIPFVFFILITNNKKVRYLGLISLLFVLINAKLTIFLLPFIALAIPNALEVLKKHETIKISLYILAFCGLFGWNIAFLMQQPTQSDLVFVSESIKLSKDTNLPLFNEPSFGYWIKAQGINTPSNPGTFLEIDFNQPGIYLTSQDLNCDLIKTEKVIGRKKINLFQCN